MLSLDKGGLTVTAAGQFVDHWEGSPLRRGNDRLLARPRSGGAWAGGGVHRRGTMHGKSYNHAAYSGRSYVSETSRYAGR